VAGVEVLRKDPLIGTRLGDYEVEECIGVGAMGVVYRAVQPIIGKRVAVKVLKAEMARSQPEIQRLLSEARTVNKIGHRGVIDIFGFGQTPDGRQYFLMEHLAGQPLDRLIADRAPLQVPEAIAILDELLDALGAIHQAGVIHRDLKPNNIFLVAQRGRPAFVKILDFGLSKQAFVDPGSPILSVQPAQQSTIAGTPEYMAPELFRGGLLSARSDLYAVGITAFELMTGKLPYPASSVTECMRLHLEAAVPEPSSVCSSVPTELDAWCLALMAKDPGQRPATAELARNDLKRVRHRLSIGETQAQVRVNPANFVEPTKQTTTDAAVAAPTELADVPERPRSILMAQVLGGATAVICAAVLAVTSQKAAPVPQLQIGALPPATVAVPVQPAAAPTAVAAPAPPPQAPPAVAARPARPPKKKLETGTLAIKARQYSTSFRVDDKDYGAQQAGRTIEGLRAGTHHVLIMQNDKKFERRVNIEAGGTAVVEVVFQ
jgi:serine/threonine-protein kinase